MSVSYGFYNSINHDRKYDAAQISRIFDGIITDGVYHSIGEAFSVSANTGLQVNVSSGRAWFNHTWIYNDSIIVLTHAEAHPVYGRIDAVVIRVDEQKRENTICVKTGTPSSNPVKPQMTNSDSVHEHPLAYVRISPNATNISPADIEYVVGTSVCPFVAGVQNGVNIDALVRNWTDEFNVLFAQLEAQITQAVSGVLIDGSVSFEKLAPDAVRRKFSNITVAKSAFEDDATYGSYGYRAKLQLTGVNSTFYPEVTFGINTLENVDIAPVVETYGDEASLDGGIYIYASSVPDDDIVIPTIVCWR